MQVEGIDVEMQKVSFLPFLIQLMVCSSLTPVSLSRI